jgi:hypothetical protein
MKILDYRSLAVKGQRTVDPRMPIAKHIGWTAPFNKNSDSEWRVPEPNNYNQAVLADKPLDCPVVANAVYYKTPDGWWSVYYVIEDDIETFREWIKTQSIQVYWFNNKPPALRNERKLLHHKKNGDITDNERLFGMGYYSTLANKYFSDNDTMLLERLGSARAEALEVLYEV